MSFIHMDIHKKGGSSKTTRHIGYSTVTDFAKFLGWSTSLPLQTAI